MNLPALVFAVLAPAGPVQAGSPYVRLSPQVPLLRNKTLVAWVAPANLEPALEARDGNPVVVLASTPIAERDFAEGRARAIWKDLLDAGAVELRDPAGLVDTLRRLPG